MAIFTAVRNKKQTAGTMMGVLKYVTQACKTMRPIRPGGGRADATAGQRHRRGVRAEAVPRF